MVNQKKELVDFEFYDFVRYLRDIKSVISGDLYAVNLQMGIQIYQGEMEYTYEKIGLSVRYLNTDPLMFLL